MNLLNVSREIIAYVFFITGSYFFINTAIGMLRSSDFYFRLQTGSQCLMSGSILILMGCIFLEGISYVSLKLIVIIIFILITNPLAINSIARFAYNSDS